MRRISGIFLIAFSLFIALGGLFTLYEDFKASMIGIFVISLPLYVIGQIVRTNLFRAREHGFKWLWAYVYGVILVPALFLSYEGYESLKEKTFSNNHFLIFESISNEKIGTLSLLFIMLLLLLLAFPFYEATFKAKRVIAIAALIVTIFYGGYQYIMWVDYRGVHEVDGLITHPWNAQEQIVPYSEIVGIVIQPHVRYASISDPTDRTHFSWRIIFTTEVQKKISYRLWLNEHSLIIGNQIKQLAHSKNIPFQVISMTENQRDEFEFQLQLKKLHKEPYYSFFGVEAEQ